MFIIGCHLSSSKGFCNMGKETEYIGANTFQFFTRNPRGVSSKKLDFDDINNFKLLYKDKIPKILAHAPYTLNPCSADPKIRELAKQMLAEDLNLLDNFDNTMYNMHPGSHLQQGVSIGINFIINTINEILTSNTKTTILLETMAGKGSEVGKTFDEISTILNNINLKHKVGVCLDTCHIWEAGYDIVNNLDKTLETFNNTIGLDKLYAIHLNDSKNPIAAHKDRHECIGKGFLGLSTVEKIINHRELRNKPFYLETPQKDLLGYKEEISLLKELYK
ncbi:MAG: deoxyribonuclease IV [Succinivibrionaceae bacterium]